MKEKIFVLKIWYNMNNAGKDI